MNDRKFRIFLIGIPVFLLTVVVISAVLTPAVYGLVDSLFPDRWPFKRIFNRVLMVSAVLVLIPWLKMLGAFSLYGLGLKCQRGWWKFLVFGFVIGLSHVALLGLLHVVVGARDWNWELTTGRFFGYLLSGMAVGLIEEFIFRGGLCLSLKALSRQYLAVVVLVGSVFFALVHFPHAEHLSGTIHPMSGWEMWSDLGRQFLDPLDVIQRWVGLFLAGVCLCVAALRTGQLWLPIGLHAGWVCGIKSNNRISDATTEASSVFWGGHPLDGIAAWVFLIVLTICLWKGPLPSVEKSA